MSEDSLQRGQTRISDAVVDTIAMVAARRVKGVMDVVGLVKETPGVGGARPGEADGALDDAAPAAARRPATQESRLCFHQQSQQISAIRLHLSAEDGADLRQLTGDVREQVRLSIRDIANLNVGDVEVVFTEIVPRQAPPRHKPPPDLS